MRIEIGEILFNALTTSDGFANSWATFPFRSRTYVLELEELK